MTKTNDAHDAARERVNPTYNLKGSHEQDRHTDDRIDRADGPIKALTQSKECKFHCKQIVKQTKDEPSGKKRQIQKYRF